VGRLSSVKRADLAAQIFAAISARFPGWRLEFAGMDTESSPGVSVWQQCQAALAGLEGRYAYHGVLDRTALNALFSRSRISLFPSAFESFGLAAVEAMAAGSVPVVSNETALPEVVADAGLICRKGEPADFVAKLSELMADEERQERLSHVAAERAGRVFSEDRILSANIDFFRRLLDSRKERRARV
jgi:glycosyltransferase involved in cell wall biosynthesis